MSKGHRRPLIVAAVFVALGGLLLSGCASPGTESDPTAEPTAGGTITIGGLATKALDPGQLGFSSQSIPWTRPVLGSLFRPGEGGSIDPEIAVGYEYNADETELTIELREGALFQDETPVDADAVVWNLNRHREPGMREGQFFTSVTDIVAKDDTTVVITFDRPFPLLLEALAYQAAGYLASPTSFDEMGADAFNAAPVGAGPFRIVRADPGQELVMEKAETYWDAENVYLDGITFVNTGVEPQAGLVQVQSGAIDAIQFSGGYTSSAVLGSGRDDPNLNEFVSANTQYLVLAVNTFSAPFDDLRARQAVAYCMDRESIAENVSRGFATPAFVGAGEDSRALDGGGWEAGKDLNPYSHDVEAGTELVEELGGLSFTIVTGVSSPVLTALQQQWAECGIEASIERSDAYLTEVHNGTYQATFTIQANQGYNPAFSTGYMDRNTATGRYGFADDTVDQLLEEVKGTVDFDEATKIWQEIWQKINDLAVLMPVLSAPNYAFTSECVQGLDPTTPNFGYTYAYRSC